MEFIEVMRNRYTTKKYNSNKKVSDQDIQTLEQILRLSPSSINSQPWRFTFVSDFGIKNKLAEVSFFNATKIIDSSHLVVFSVIDSVSLFENQIEEKLPVGAVGYYNQFLKNKGADHIKSWLSNQVYLALGVFLSGCATMKIDSTPMEGIIGEKYDEILSQDHYKSLFAVAIGYRDENDPNQPKLKSKIRNAIEDVIIPV